MENLKQEIEQKRRELMMLADEKSFLAPEVLEKSQELDRLLVQYYRSTLAAL